MEPEVKTYLVNIVQSTIDQINAGTINLVDIFPDKTDNDRASILTYIQSQPIRVMWADPRDPAQVPCIAILRNDEGETKEFIGDYLEQEEIDESGTKKTYKYYGTPQQCDYALNIWAQNTEVREFLYRIGKYSLFINRMYLETKGMMLQRLSGGDQEGAQSPYFPDFVYIARIGMNFKTELAAPIKYSQITDVELGQIDTYSKNYLKNARFLYWTNGSGPFGTADIETADEWFLSIVSGTDIEVEKSKEQIFAELNNLKVTANDTKGGIYQLIDESQYLPFLGKQVHCYCWIYCTVDSKVKISVSDGVGETKSDYHTGTGWEKIRVEHNVASNAGKLQVNIFNDDFETGTELIYYVTEINLN